MVKRVTTIFSGVQGAPYYSNMYFSDSTSAENAVTAVDDFWTGVETLITAACTWTVQGDVYTIDVASGDITGVSSVGGANGVGTSGSEELPQSNQILVKWATGQFASGRLVRGRTFIPALTEPSNNLGGVAGTPITTANNAAQALIDDPESTFQIYSRTHQLAATVLTADTWNQFAVLRSRRD